MNEYKSVGSDSKLSVWYVHHKRHASVGFDMAFARCKNELTSPLVFLYGLSLSCKISTAFL